MVNNKNTELETNESETEGVVLDESELLLEVVRSIVCNPEKVEIETVRGEKTTVLTISVDNDDYGQVVGRFHRTLDAINHLFSKAASLEGRKVIIQLNSTQVFRKPRVEHRFTKDSRKGVQARFHRN
jgi:predicted RNA-binding protein YlqC (UPF0109 family)